jgi:ABC-type Fe3+/spermidine/putrescine transport system ATPase subunit
MSELTCKNMGYKQVLHDIDLRVRRGKVTALVGPSGVGKSTLLWVLAGLWKPTRGSATRPTGRLGMVFQDHALWDHLTVQQHLSIVGATPQRSDQLLRQLGLEELGRRRPGRMSGGECRRLAIARALAVEPAWLLLDEPMAHLDGPARQQLFEALGEAIAHSGAGVVIATHQAQEAMRLADEIAVMIDGRITQLGPPQEVYRKPATLEVARMLGPASELRGQILRPDEVRLAVDPAGVARVRRCDFIGGTHHVVIESEGTLLVAAHDQPMEPGERVTVTIAKRGACD